MTHLLALTVPGSPLIWGALGLPFVDGVADLAGISLEINSGTPSSDATQSRDVQPSWTLGAAPGEVLTAGETRIDGVVTIVRDSRSPGLPHATEPPVVAGATSPIGRQRIVGVDHVVVNTDDQDRTCGEFERVLGLTVRRARDAGNGVQQRFLRLDNTIIEVVSGPHVRSVGASLWGFVLSVDDLFDLADELGPEVLSPPRRAVQPGRHIATVRSSVGLGVAVAMMTPHVAGSPTH